MLKSQLDLFPNIGALKPDLLNIPHTLRSIAASLSDDANTDSFESVRRTLGSFYVRSKEGWYYSDESYRSNPYSQSFKEVTTAVLILNDQIGDTILSLPLVDLFTQVGKKIVVCTKRRGMVSYLLRNNPNILEVVDFDYQRPVLLNNPRVTNESFVVNLHRYFWQYDLLGRFEHPVVSLDWRIVPLFDEERYSFTNRICHFLEILLGYKLSPTLQKLYGQKGEYTYLVVGASSRYKELSESQWLDLVDRHAGKRLRIVKEYIDERADLLIQAFIKSGKEAERYCMDLDDPSTYFPEANNVIGLDTGLTHLASYLGIQTILINTVSNWKCWRLENRNTRIIRSALSDWLVQNNFGHFDPVYSDSFDEKKRALEEVH